MAVDLGELDERERALVHDAAQRAASRFPWYAQRLARGRDIPILREPDLSTDYYATTTDSADVQVYETSGTATGVRKKVRWSAEDHARYVAQRAALIS